MGHEREGRRRMARTPPAREPACGQEEAVTDIESQVCADIKARQELGIAKYGVTVAENPLNLKQWLTHAYEECLDQAVYLKRAMEELE